MKDYIRQSFYFAFLFVLIDLMAKVILHRYWPEWRGADAFMTLLIGCWLGFLYFISCLVWKGRYKQWLLPSFRITFWVGIVLLGLVKGDRMATEDFLYANNELFNVWLLFSRLINLRDTSEALELIFQDIILLAFFEWVLIYFASMIASTALKSQARVSLD